MHKKTLLLIVLFPTLLISQIRNYDTYSFHKHSYTLETGYGLTGFQNTRDDENIRAVGHFDLGIKWMGGKVWGAKISYAKDKTRVLRNEIETGCDYTRISVELVNNLTNMISEVHNYDRKFNIYAHGGAGYAYQTSTVLTGTDELGNVVFGINPQYSITDRLSLGADLTGIANFSRHFDFNGQRVLNGSGISETGFFYNASITLSYTYWKSDNRKKIIKNDNLVKDSSENSKVVEKSKTLETSKKTETKTDEKTKEEKTKEEKSKEEKLEDERFYKMNKKIEKDKKKIERENKKMKEKLNN
jgi:hypothetical protein